MKSSMYALLAAMAGILTGCGAAEPAAPVAVGEIAPSFSLTALDGRTVTAESLEGEPAVLNFWATWCQPCLKELPELKAFARENEVALVGIALDEEGAGPIKRFVKRNEINYTVLLGNQKTFQKFNGYGIPYTLVLDGERRIVSVYRGPVTREQLERDLARVASSAG